MSVQKKVLAMVHHCRCWFMAVRAGQVVAKKWVGLRGVRHYLQRTAIQGSPTMITAISNVFQAHAKGNQEGKHPFKKYFEELAIGDQIVTEKRLITAEDIDKFADLSGDHFYAHLKATDFEWHYV